MFSMTALQSFSPGRTSQAWKSAICRSAVKLDAEDQRFHAQVVPDHPGVHCWAGQQGAGQANVLAGPGQDGGLLQGDRDLK